MKNKTKDLNDHLFSALERLSDESLTNEKLEIEIERSKTIVQVAGQVIDSGRMVIKAEELKHEYGMKKSPLLLLSEGEDQ